MSKKLDRTGEKYLMNNGLWLEIIEYINAENLSIKFEDGYIQRNIRMSQIKTKSVGNPYARKIFGFGFLGEGEHAAASSNGVNTNKYLVWYRMIERTHSEKRQIKQPSYIGCSVCDEWANFQIFGDWFDKNYIEGYVIDKDILFKGNKLYSPNTCTFVPGKVNLFFTKCDVARGDLPIGVKRNGPGYIGQINIFDKRLFSQTFNTVDKAFNWYKFEKENYCALLAEEYKDKISNATYQALINYKVDIND